MSLSPRHSTTAQEANSTDERPRHDTGRWSIAHEAQNAATQHALLSRRGVIRMALTTLAMLGVGCASVPGAMTAAAAPKLPVRIEGLGFLGFNMEREIAVSAMRSRGYLCFEEAATAEHSPCMRSAKDGSGEVMLAFKGATLDAVSTPLRVVGIDSRNQFERLLRQGRDQYGAADVQQSKEMAIARFHPGDGSTLSLHHYFAAGTIVSTHTAPVPAETVSGRKLAAR